MAASKPRLNLIAAIVPAFIVVAGVVAWVVIHRGESAGPTTTSPPTAPNQANKDDGPPLSADTGDLAKRIYAAGMKSLHGDGVPQNTPKAIQLLSQAVQLGNAEAACTLGKLYSTGQGVGKSDTESFRWFNKAAQKGNAEGMSALASAYENGTGVAANPVAAKMWYEKAAAAGDANAIAALAAIEKAGAASK